eukprot:CAMPEP_0172153226 /NCGR_PEP_ID=MMETSP1050-20130122/1311_1 /TAXON_ID=233186 /ORGANISM="Cryptomonas curvata, Strain CCAP979/52" /LENGTH=116 /DNA_ID=CAMNT_0012821707 /DNA_START=366 /DNA_END=712 /DNA_ORIENTATION=+
MTPAAARILARDQYQASLRSSSSLSNIEGTANAQATGALAGRTSHSIRPLIPIPIDAILQKDKPDRAWDLAWKTHFTSHDTRPPSPRLRQGAAALARVTHRRAQSTTPSPLGTSGL